MLGLKKLFPPHISTAGSDAPSYVEWTDIFPYVGLYDRFIVDVFGGVHLVMSTYFPQTDICTDDQLARFRSKIRGIFLSLPREISQIDFSYTCNGDYTPLIDEFVGFEGPEKLAELRRLRGSRLKARVKVREIVRVETHLILSVAPPNRQVDGEMSQKLSNQGHPTVRRYQLTKAEFEVAAHALRGAEEICQTMVRESGGRASSCDCYQIAGYFYRLFNPELAIELGIPLNYNYETEPFADAFMCQEAFLTRKSLQIGDYHHAYVSVAAKPTETVHGVAERFTLNLPFRDARVSLKVRRLDLQAVMEKLRKKIDLASQLTTMSTNIIDKFMKPYEKDRDSGQHNVDATSMRDEAKDHLRKLRAGEEEDVVVDMGVHLWNRDLKVLGDNVNTIINVLVGLANARGWRDRSSLLPVFVSSLPGVYAPFQRPLQIPATMAADLAPVCRGFETNEFPKQLFLNSASGLVALDLENLSETTAPMVCVSGATGEGKSVLAGMIAHRHLHRESIFVVVDRSDSYNRLIRVLDGTILDLDPEKPTCFNIFQIFGAETSNGIVVTPGDAQMNQIMASLEILMMARDSSRSLTEENRKTLLGMIEKTYFLCRKSGSPLVTLSDLGHCLREDKDTEWMLDRLRPFMKGGTYADWFDGGTQLSLKTQVFKLGFGGIKEDAVLMAAFVPLSVIFIGNLLKRNRQARNVLLFGEMWAAVNNQQIADLMINAFKTYRKEGVIVIGETQSFGDFYENPIVAKAVVDNTHTWFMFNQGSTGSLQLAGKELELTQGQMDIVKDLGKQQRLKPNKRPEIWREALMVRGRGNHQASGRIRNDMEPEEYWLMTSDPDDVPLYNVALKTFGGDDWTTIKSMASQYPLGYGVKRDKKGKVIGT